MIIQQQADFSFYTSSYISMYISQKVDLDCKDSKCTNSIHAIRKLAQQYLKLYPQRS